MSENQQFMEYEENKTYGGLNSNVKLSNGMSDDKIQEFEDFLDSIDQPKQSKGGFSKTQSTSQCFSLDYYKQYFDINSAIVLDRIKKSLIPLSQESFFGEAESDLYGPFWLSTTLILILPIVGNAISYMESSGTAWAGNFSMIITACTLVYPLIFGIPLLTYFIQANEGGQGRYVDFLSIYGYSITAIIVSATTCCFLDEQMRWISMTLGVFWSLFFLWKNYIKEVDNFINKASTVIRAIVVLGHLWMICATNWYFFNNSIQVVTNQS